MASADVFHLSQWHDFFMMTGGATAALTGLVFVAMSLNVKVINQDPTHRFRAIGTLSGFAAVFMVCALALMGGQHHLAVGVEWLVVSVVAAYIYVYGYVQAIRQGGSTVGLGTWRLVTGSFLYVTQAVGAALIVAGARAGMYVAATSAVVLLGFMISGAWLLIVRVSATDAASSLEG